MEELRDSQFEKFWANNYAPGFSKLPGILQQSWKEVAKASWDEAWAILYEELGEIAA